MPHLRTEATKCNQASMLVPSFIISNPNSQYIYAECLVKGTGEEDEEMTRRAVSFVRIYKSARGRHRRRHNNTANTSYASRSSSISIIIMPTAAQPRRYHHHAHAHFLEFHSVRAVPDSHAWPDLHDRPTSPDNAVPVVDLSSHDGLLDQLRRACASWGAFQVTGHGVPLGLLRSAEAAARRLFTLPLSQKLRAARREDGSVGGYGAARISCFFPKLMWSEGFTIAGSPLDNARELWPGDPAAFCDVIEEYKKQMQRLAHRLTRLMLTSLGLAEGDIDWAGLIEEMSAVVQLNSYPACPDPDRAMGLAAHTDSTLLTVLYQSNTSGLQVLHPMNQDRPSRWVTVPPIPDALIVNVGDLFQILSNGRYRSAVHRVIVNRTSHRVSVAYMCGPEKDADVSPIEKLIEPGGRPLYRTVTWPEYLSLKGKLFDKALEHIMLQEHSTG
ncbi:hypothetical protein Cni_G07342 [Canna indica]|uniref:gibberellin 3beta-dioxygenase n=1 Tax=Canna indica TaxID=4628 RepID=A0AAQ3K3N6_9LILI|nr:hypothetical protein Cni_G07342 [Canna indica]